MERECDVCVHRVPNSATTYQHCDLLLWSLLFINETWSMSMKTIRAHVYTLYKMMSVLHKITIVYR